MNLKLYKVTIIFAILVCFIVFLSYLTSDNKQLKISVKSQKSSYSPTVIQHSNYSGASINTTGILIDGGAGGAGGASSVIIVEWPPNF